MVVTDDDELQLEENAAESLAEDEDGLCLEENAAEGIAEDEDGLCLEENAAESIAEDEDDLCLEENAAESIAEDEDNLCLEENGGASAEELQLEGPLHDDGALAGNDGPLLKSNRTAATDDDVLGVGSSILYPTEKGVLLLAAVVGFSQRGQLEERATIQFQEQDAPPGEYLADRALMVPWKGYLTRVLDGVAQGEVNGGAAAPRVTSARMRSLFYSCWRCDIAVEGLFSLVLWAVGFLEHEHRARPDAQLLIDWTNPAIAFSAFDRKQRRDVHANLWNDFFEQPFVPPHIAVHDACGAPSLAELERAASSTPRRLRVVCHCGRPKYFAKFADFCGAQDRGGNVVDDAGGTSVITGGRLNQKMVADGRRAFGQWLRPRPHIAARVAATVRERLRSGIVDRWLAVHLRRTDKLQRCVPNRIPVESAAAQAAAFAAALECTGVLVCTDDAQFKSELVSSLSSRGLGVATISSVLSSQPGVPSHMAAGGLVDRRRNAEDCLVETLVMAQCEAILASWSNVSVAAIFFSPPTCPHFMFGDAPPVAPPRAIALTPAQPMQPSPQRERPRQPEQRRADAGESGGTARSGQPPTAEAGTCGGVATESLLFKQVRLHGLKGKPELNATRGQVLSYHEGNGRWEVMLRGSAKTVWLKAANLQLVRAPPSPPKGADGWPAELLQRWHDDGGVLLFSAIEQCAAFAGGKGNVWLDMVGHGLPVRPLETLHLSGGLLQALASERAGSMHFTDMARTLARDGWVATELYPSAATAGDTWARINAEGEALRPYMQPGKLMRPDGSAVPGISPSGAKRGDVSVYIEADVKQRALEAPTLLRLNDAIVQVGSALARALATVERVPGVGFDVAGCSDGKFARFPGDGSGYNAHTDGTKAGVVLTSILYTNAAWKPAHGGELHMLDETRGAEGPCWRSVAPEANRVLWFRHKVLHKVCPAHAPRYALTHFWFDRSAAPAGKP